MANTTVCALKHPAVLLQEVTPLTYLLQYQHARLRACELQLVCNWKTLEVTSMP